MSWRPPETDEWIPPTTDEVISDKETPQRSFGETVMASAKDVLTSPGRILQNSTPERISEHAPVLGAVGGEMLAGPLGAAAGAGGGQILKRMADVAYGRVQPSEAMDPVKEATVPMIQSTVAGIPGVGGVKNAIQNLAQKAGTRALGFTKRMMKRGGEEQAKETAQAMLDKGVIKFGSGAKATLDRAEDVAEAAGQSMNKAGEQFSKEGLKPLDTNEIGLKISEQLSPKFSGGAYDAEKKIVDEIVDTVGAHGNGPINFESAQQLKQKLQELGKFLSNTDATRANLYRRASGVVREAIDQAVQTSGSASAKTYLAGKKSYGNASRAIEGLSDKVSAQLANNPVGPYSVIAGASRIVSGDVPGGLAALGAVEGVKRVGAGSTASLLNTLNNSARLNNSRRAILAEFISRLRGQRE